MFYSCSRWWWITRKVLIKKYWTISKILDITSLPFREWAALWRRFQLSSTTIETATEWLSEQTLTVVVKEVWMATPWTIASGCYSQHRMKTERMINSNTSFLHFIQWMNWLRQQSNYSHNLFSYVMYMANETINIISLNSWLGIWSLFRRFGFGWASFEATGLNLILLQKHQAHDRNF